MSRGIKWILGTAILTAGFIISLLSSFAAANFNGESDMFYALALTEAITWVISVVWYMIWYARMNSKTKDQDSTHYRFWWIHVFFSTTLPMLAGAFCLGKFYYVLERFTAGVYAGCLIAAWAVICAVCAAAYVKVRPR